MEDNLAGGAPAPAEPNALAPQTATQNNPISVQTSAEPPKQPEKPISASDAIKAAQEKIAAKEKEPAPKQAEQSKAGEKARGEDGKFTPKEPQKTDPKIAEAEAKAKGAPEPVKEGGQSEGRVSRYEAPARFNEQGKAEWANAPESVQAEIHRTIKNLEDGHAKYKDAAERWEKIREFDEVARRNGREGLHDSLKQIVEFEQAMMRNPIEGFQKIAQHFGVNLNAVAAHLAGQQPNQQVEAIHRENQQLKAQISQLQQAQEMPNFVASFADQHERFYDLQEDIAFFLKTMAKEGSPQERLETAYQLADRFRPANANASPANAEPGNQASPAAETASPAPVQPKTAGQKSISGAPSSGVTSGGKKRVMSTSEALKTALAQAS